MADIIMTQNHRYTFSALNGSPVLVDSSDHAGGTTVFNNKVDIQDINGDTSGQLTIRSTNADTQYGPQLFLRQMGTGDVGLCMYDGTTTWSIGVDSNVDTELRFCNSNGMGTNTEMKISTTGTLSVTGDVIAYASDKRLKENILIIEDPIEKIKRLRGVHFDWNELAKEEGFEPDRQKNEIGVIAQELEAVIPQAVYDAPFDHQYKGTDRENYKTVKYEKIIPLLIEGIKEQQKQIESLEVRIKKLENK